MNKIKSLVNPLEYPLIRSFFENKAIKPTDWIDELKKALFPDRIIIEMICFYRILISYIVKTYSFFINIKNDFLLAYVEKILSDNHNDFIKKYFNIANEYEVMISIFRFNNNSTEFSKYGLCDTHYETKLLHDSLRQCVDICFTTKLPECKLSDYIKKNYSNDKNIKDILIKAKGINFFELDFNKISNLFSYFDRSLLSFHEVSQNIKNSNLNDLYISLKLKNISIFTSKLINSLIGINNSINKMNVSNEILKDIINEKFEENMGEHEKTRNLITKKAFEITNEIINVYITIPVEHRYKPTTKLWMHARHPEFDEPLKLMIKNGIIIEEPTYYSFRYIPKQGQGLNILAYCIYMYADLSKKANVSYENSHDKNDEEYKGYFTYRVYEPFSIAFDIPNLQNNIRKDKIPAEFDDFVKKSGLSKCHKYAL